MAHPEGPLNERNIDLRKRTKTTVTDVEIQNHDDERGAQIFKYGIEDTPPWYMTILFGFQHYLLVFGATITPALIITPAMCIGGDDVGKSEVISTVFFVDGIATLLQTTFGSRLPIFQGGRFSFIAPALAVLALPTWECPAGPPDIANLTAIYGTSMNINETLLAWRRDVWTSRQREIQGSLALASIFQLLLGITGTIGMILPFIGPLCIAPTITLIGLALFGFAAEYCAKHWGISCLTMVLIIVFSQYLARIRVPFPAFSRGKGCHMMRYPIFQFIPVILAIGIAWAICAILTAADQFPSDPTVLGYEARTDVKLKVLDDAKWFRFPYPGVFFEGIGIACAAVWGSTTGVTSYSHNIAAIGITKVASRRVMQVGGLIAILLGMFGKFGAIFVTMPEPIFGGIFMTLFGLVAAVGVSSLQHVDLNSSRNLFIYGFCVLLGLAVPSWIGTHQDVLKTGNSSVDQVLFVLLNTPMLIGAFVGFLLDNTIPGTPEERGLAGWRGQHGAGKDQDGMSTYDLPFGMNLIRRVRWLRFLPISPTYQEPSCDCCTCCRPRGEQQQDVHGYDNPVVLDTSL